MRGEACSRISPPPAGATRGDFCGDNRDQKPAAASGCRGDASGTTPALGGARCRAAPIGSTRVGCRGEALGDQLSDAWVPFAKLKPQLQIAGILRHYPMGDAAYVTVVHDLHKGLPESMAPGGAHHYESHLTWVKGQDGWQLQSLPQAHATPQQQPPPPVGSQAQGVGQVHSAIVVSPLGWSDTRADERAAVLITPAAK